MEKSLVIVESPAKAKTINRYLGPGYIVKASMGHVRDLPKSKLGVDVEHDFEPKYVIIPDRKKVVAELQKAAKEAKEVILAADPDREGEAICWHLSAILGPSNPRICRTLLHEITKHGVEEAFRNCGPLDRNMIEAQQTRRILDRLVGYLISPLLWKKIARGLSAGRVQSVALRLICEREKEIKAFVSAEYWSIAAFLEAAQPPSFKALLVKVDGKKAKIPDATSAGQIVDDLRAASFVLQSIEVREKRKSPAPPYITSTLQQDGFRFLRFPVKKTMFVAQKLYEGLSIGERGPTGLITYMRTDSVRISNEAAAWARTYIETNFSREYLPAKPHFFSNKTQAQDAHEAIRPTLPELTPEAVRPYLKKEEYDVYRLIWNRFIASQMSSALIEETEFDIRADKYQFKAKGEVIKFPGFLALTRSAPAPVENGENGNEAAAAKEPTLMPQAQKGETLKLLEVEPKQNFTQPPPRYTEGTLVKELEAKGIGRPSTYAPIIATLQDRVYVVKDKGKFAPTDVGMFVTDFMVKQFADLMDYGFTALMEEELDKISEGRKGWLDSLRSYYTLLDQDLKRSMLTEGVKATGIPTQEICPKCGKPLVIKSGRFGRFKACSGYPDCDFKESLVKREVKTLEEKCPTCEKPLVYRYGKFGSFIACSNYPACKYIKKEKTDTGLTCPEDCGGTIIRRKTRRGKIFYGCSQFPKCRFASWDEPLARPCPKCGRKIILKKEKKGESYLYCSSKECSFKETIGGGTPQAQEGPLPAEPQSGETG